MSAFKLATIGQTAVLRIKKNGVEVSKYRPDLSNAEIDLSSVAKTNTTGSFTTITGGILESCDVTLTPKQDLHGYDKPWVGGSGKNKLPLTVANLKSINTGGTWNGNIYTLDGVTFTVNTDNDGNVIGIKINGTSLSEVSFMLANPLSSLTVGTSYIFTSGNSTGSFSTYLINIPSGGSNASEISFTYDDVNMTFARIIIRNNVSVNNQIFYPMIRLATVTDATFEPYTNICGITGHTAVEVWEHGKNLFPLSAVSALEQGVLFTVNRDKTITTTRQSTSSSNASINIGDFTLPVGSYKISGANNAGNGAYFTLRNASNNAFIANVQADGYDLTVTDASFVYRLTCVVSSSVSPTGDYATVSPMVRKATETDSTFAPYQGQDITISLGQTVYGGSLDAVSGVLTVDKGGVDLGSLTWEKHNEAPYWFRATIPYSMKSGWAETIDGICEMYQPSSGSSIYTGSVDGAFGGSATVVYIIDSTKTSLDATSFKTAMNGVDMVYALATPLTIQLTPQQIETLIGENHLDIPLEGQTLDSAVYRELFAWDDVEKAIEPKSDISAIGTDESGRTTASKAYAIGEQFYKDGKFCTAIASISSGATLTLNTNYVEGTIADNIRYEEATFSNVKFARFGKVCYMVDVPASVSVGADGETVCTVSEKFRPKEIHITYTKCWNGSAYVDTQIRIETTGAVKIRSISGQVIQGIQPVFVQSRPCYLAK